MSCYEWEAGTITLPSVAVAPVKKAVRDAQNKLHADVLAECKRVWRDVLKQTRSTKLYEERLREWAYRDNYDNVVTQAVSGVLWGLSEHPRQAQVADLRWVPRATNRTNAFHLGESSITFDGRKVTWSVSENNHACEHARSHPVAQAFFAALARVSWTRGTGGQIVGNNEYNRESEGLGGGGNYLVEEFGPKVKRQQLVGSYRW